VNKKWKEESFEESFLMRGWVIFRVDNRHGSLKCDDF
jgi:hypothetical protein